MYRTLLIAFIALLFSGALFSQEPGISVKADKQKILLGEPFHLSLHAVYPYGSGIHAGFDSIPHFEFSERAKIDSSISNQLVSLDIQYTLTSFDSGHWVIPALIINDKWRSDSIPIDVQFSEFDSSQPYHPIKEILEVPAAKRSEWWWYVLGGVVLLAFVFFYFSKKKKTPEMVVIKEGIDPYKEAMMGLAGLADEKGDPKLYYSKLVMVLRVYLKRKKNIQSLQKTTADLIIKMQELPLGREEMDKLSQTLRMADMVKFAKYIPDQHERDSSLTSVRSCIEMIESAANPSTQA